ncbi:methylmalonyl-CoA epimerase [Natronobiforma cellulositropha]|uniref:methylmalonyl-CoA epimerase n=1 Tax=Natronobiforma cellulositropha TaxID=1679076 RepID=UPI0021D59FC3|nr:methylmalonyl-CoA epimerase [Natronobiforma cellulositropha]
MRIDHVGIATDDAAALAELFADLLAVEVVHEETFDGLRVVFLDCENSLFELLEPVDDEGPIARFLERRGSGIHHVAFETDDAAAALERAREVGIEPVDEEPRPGAWGHEVAFLHPRDTGGVLVEFVEH